MTLFETSQGNRNSEGLLLCDFFFFFSWSSCIYNCTVDTRFKSNLFYKLHLRAALKVMPPSLLCWPMMSEVDVGSMAVEVSLPDTIPLHDVVM